MRVVIDTNILVAAVRDLSLDHILVLGFLREFGHHLALDHNGRLLCEYQNNVGKQVLFQKWYQEMQYHRLIYWCNGCLSNRIASELINRGMHEPNDHVVVALAVNGDKYIITEDSDFGKGDPRRAAEHQRVLEYLIQILDLVVHDARQACQRIRAPDLD